MLTLEEKNFYENIITKEPEITAIVPPVVQAIGGEMQGLQYRIKTMKSLDEKLHGRSEESQIEDCHDIIRYTAIFDPDILAEKIPKVLEQLVEAGCQVVKFKNTWGKDSTYCGINCQLLIGGVCFELQFHTKESFFVKDVVLHPLYERLRVLDEENEEEAAEAKRIRAKMVSVNRKMNWPKGIKNVIWPIN